jgi:hypothetical protein
MKSTLSGGPLRNIENCYIIIPRAIKIILNNLPNISDSKQVSYNDEPVMGRATPVKTYSHSAPRLISMDLHFYVTHPSDIERNLGYLRALESAAYPNFSSAMPFTPPPVCRLRCGKLLADEGDVCAILTSYSVKFDTKVAWDEETFVPFQFDVETNWEVVYKSSDLPGQERIFRSGV